ncbi:hypothetical protein DITRI_Ditri13aG0122200 [Diplodiscus trichospermus]
MLKRGSITIPLLPSTAVLVGRCRWRRWLRRRKGSTIRLGNKAKRRRFCLGSRPVVQWEVMAKNDAAAQKLCWNLTEIIGVVARKIALLV